jgi:hypothetical protein
MRRALVLGAVGVLLAAGVALALLIAPQPTAQASPAHITRLFIPAIKTACLLDTLGPTDERIGFTFTEDNALTTIDQDGSLTGIPAPTLHRLNACLAQYPIEPTRELPHDHYSRNLLYDYDQRVLKPCLETALGRELPDLPDRSDFVVRLYVWEPYSALSRQLALPDLLALTAECPAVPAYLDDTPAVDPAFHLLSSQAQRECFSVAGIITYSTEAWKLDGIYLRVYDPQGDVVAALNTQVDGVITGRTVLNCLNGVS